MSSTIALTARQGAADLGGHLGLAALKALHIRGRDVHHHADRPAPARLDPQPPVGAARQVNIWARRIWHLCQGGISSGTGLLL